MNRKTVLSSDPHPFFAAGDVVSGAAAVTVLVFAATVVAIAAVIVAVGGVAADEAVDKAFDAVGGAFDGFTGAVGEVLEGAAHLQSLKFADGLVDSTALLFGEFLGVLFVLSHEFLEFLFGLGPLFVGERVEVLFCAVDEVFDPS